MLGLYEHAIAYLLTTAAFLTGYLNRPAWSLALALSMYAAVLEAGQLIAPGRQAALLDWSGSVSGVLAAWLVIVAWRARASRPP